MSKNNEDKLIKRLVLIKYLYLIAKEQSKQFGTFSAFSILAFHDCVEMLLILIVQQKNGKIQNHFLEYWKEIAGLPYKSNMENLNLVRKNLKHYALFPNKEEIDRCCDDVRIFLTDIIQNYFNTDFDELRLSSLITFDKVKEDVEKAETFMKENHFYESLEKSKTAFMKLLATYDSNKEQWRNSILNIGEKVSNDYRELEKCYNDSNEWFEQTTQTINSVRDILKISALGIDYRRYSLFNFITPRVLEGCDSTGNIYVSERKEDFESTRNVSIQDCQFCIDFVVECALKLQEFDFDIKNYIERKA